MGSLPPTTERPPHAVMVPYPAQGHVTPMLQLAKLLHARGFDVTFVNNEFNHRRHLRARSTARLGSASPPSTTGSRSPTRTQRRTSRPSAAPP
jgi:hypothetical protein